MQLFTDVTKKIPESFYISEKGKKRLKQVLAVGLAAASVAAAFYAFQSYMPTDNGTPQTYTPSEPTFVPINDTPESVEPAETPAAVDLVYQKAKEAGYGEKEATELSEEFERHSPDTHETYFLGFILNNQKAGIALLEGGITDSEWKLADYLIEADGVIAGMGKPIFDYYAYQDVSEGVLEYISQGISGISSSNPFFIEQLENIMNSSSSTAKSIWFTDDIPENVENLDIFASPENLYTWLSLTNDKNGVPTPTVVLIGNDLLDGKTEWSIELYRLSDGTVSPYKGSEEVRERGVLFRNTNGLFETNELDRDGNPIGEVIIQLRELKDVKTDSGRNIQLGIYGPVTNESVESSYYYDLIFTPGQKLYRVKLDRADGWATYHSDGSFSNFYHVSEQEQQDLEDYITTGDKLFKAIVLNERGNLFDKIEELYSTQDLVNNVTFFGAPINPVSQPSYVVSPTLEPLLDIDRLIAEINEPCETVLVGGPVANYVMKEIGDTDNSEWTLPDGGEFLLASETKKIRDAYR